MKNKEAIKDLLDSYFPLQEPDVHVVEEVNNKICINGLCPMPVKVSHCFNREVTVELMDESSNKIGELIFLKDYKASIVGLPQAIFYCFISENHSDTVTEQYYIFQNDYVLIEKDKLEGYLDKNRGTSAIWGGFLHIEDLVNHHYSKVKTINQIVAVDGLKIDGKLYLDNLEQAIADYNPFNRFLKLYHLLELKFDMHTAEKIRDYLSQTGKEKEISRLLKEYNYSDINRLTSLLALKVNPWTLISLLDQIQNYLKQAEEIFYIYGKESNPLNAKTKFDDIIKKGGFSEQNVNQVLGNQPFKSFIPKLAAYWIYRIRSSIAHNKLGEYLITHSDEEFIVEFAEPLIKEVIKQCYKV